MTDVVIAGAARTAIGSYGKSLKGVAPSDLGATAARAALERAGVAPEQVEHVVFGNVIHTEPGDAYMARVVGMKAGVPKETPACRTTPRQRSSCCSRSAPRSSAWRPRRATGSAITAKCLSEMEREGPDLGLVTLCIGGGQGIALLLGRP